MSKLRSCSDSHQSITFEGDECPLCRANLRLVEFVDRKEDIDGENIEYLLKQLKHLNKRIVLLESKVFSNSKKQRKIQREPWIISAPTSLF